MRQEESFFVNLFKLKIKSELKSLNEEIKIADLESEEKKENEWYQEYELIYQSYALE